MQASSKRDRHTEKVKLRLYWTGSQSGDSPTSSHNESVSNRITLDALQERLKKKFNQSGSVLLRSKSQVKEELVQTDDQLQAFFSQYFTELENSKTREGASTGNTTMATYRLKLFVSAAASSPSCRSPPSKKQAIAALSSLATPSVLQGADPSLRPRNTVWTTDTPKQKKQKHEDLENASPVSSPPQDLSWDRGVLRSIIKTVSKHHFCSASPQSNHSKLLHS